MREKRREGERGTERKVKSDREREVEKRKERERERVMEVVGCSYSSLK